MIDRRCAVLLGGLCLIAGCTGGPTAPPPVVMQIWIAPPFSPKNAVPAERVNAATNGADAVAAQPRLNRTSRSAAR
jgi:hypothetical protein